MDSRDGIGISVRVMARASTASARMGSSQVTGIGSRLPCHGGPLVNGSKTQISTAAAHGRLGVRVSFHGGPSGGAATASAPNARASLTVALRRIRV